MICDTENIKLVIKIKIIIKIIYMSERQIHIAELHGKVLTSTKTRQLYWLTIQKQLSVITLGIHFKNLEIHVYTGFILCQPNLYIRSILTQNPEIY